MSDMQFSQLELDPRIEKAVKEMGFDRTTPIQEQVIPLICGGADVIAKSQTGTGKTAAFAIPALETIDTDTEKPRIQVLILCPTRELAQQAGEEIRKLARFLPGIRLIEVYGGANMERQFIQLRRANIVVGTPGRVIDHMRRGTIKLQHLKMIVLDEADEMLNMGFKEDIETILQDTPEERQTVLFSATMPPAILSLAKTFLRDPQTVEINKSQVTLDQIDQSCVEVPLSKKKEALNLLLRFHQPNRALIFCNTKRMVDELGEYLNHHGFSAESIHGDLKQLQRTRVMSEFKRGRVAILIATDVAARGIDVNDLDYVINYDIPMNTEYYIHRIGRTGRAGKFGRSITLFSGKRQKNVLRELSGTIKAEIREDGLPTQEEIEGREHARNIETVVEALEQGAGTGYDSMAARLTERGYPPERVAAVLLSLLFPRKELPPEILLASSREIRREGDQRPAKAAPITFTDVVVDVGSANRAEPKHLVGAITERAGLSGKEVGKIEVYPDYSVIGIPETRVNEVVAAMRDCKICGKTTRTIRLADQTRGGGPGPRKATKSLQLSGQLVAKYSQGRVAGPTRKKRKIPDFEG